MLYASNIPTIKQEFGSTYITEEIRALSKVNWSAFTKQMFS